MNSVQNEDRSSPRARGMCTALESTIMQLAATIEPLKACFRLLTSAQKHQAVCLSAQMYHETHSH